MTLGPYPSFLVFAVHSKSWEARAGVYTPAALITKFRTPNQKEFTDFLWYQNSTFAAQYHLPSYRKYERNPYIHSYASFAVHLTIRILPNWFSQTFMILGDLQLGNNGPEMVLFTWRKNPLEKCFFFSECEMMTKDSLRLKRVFLLLNNQTSFPICDFHVVSALPWFVCNSCPSYYLISTAAELKSNFILHLATLLWDPPDYLQTYVTLLTCLKNGQKTKNKIRFLPYFPSCRLLHPCHSIKISFGSDKNYIFCVISAL